MLENCSTLIDCEKVLAAALPGVEFVGQAGLSYEEVQLLSAFVRERLSGGDLHGRTGYLINHTPAALACYLVGHGVYNYRDGDYWGSLSRVVGVYDLNWQVRVGQAFLNHLQKLQLPVLDITGAHRYVANILLHGGIPQECMPEFFEQVLYPALLDDLVDPDAVKACIREWNELERQNLELAATYRALEREKLAIASNRREIRQYGELRAEINTLQKQVDDFLVAGNLPENYDDFRQTCVLELTSLTHMKESLQQQEEACRGEVEKFSERYGELAETAETVGSLMLEYGNLADVFHLLARLKGELNSCVTKMDEFFIELGLNEPPVNYESLLAEIPWEQVFTILGEGEELETRVFRLEGIITKVKIKRDKPGPIFWTGFAIFVAGLHPVMKKSLNVPFWFLPACGVSLMGYRWWKYRAGQRENDRQEKRLARLVKEKDHLQEEMGSLKNKLRQLCGCLSSPGASFWEKRMGEMAFFFSELQHTYHELVINALREEEAREWLSGWRSSFAEASASLELELEYANDDLDLEGSFVKVRERIDEVRQQKAAMEEAGARLQDILAELACLDEKIGQIEADLENEEAKIELLGGGKLSSGLSMLYEYREKTARLNKLQEEVGKLELGLVGRERHLSTLTQLQLDDLLLELEREYGQKEKELAAAEQERESATRPLAYLDKPLRRFLLYGGDWAVRWLVDGGRLAADLMAGKKEVDDGDTALPAWFAPLFLEWWEHRNSGPGAETEQAVAARQRFLAPELLLGPAGDITLFFPGQRFNLDNEGNEAWLRIGGYGEGAGEELLPLKVYLHGARLGETEPLNFPVARLAVSYELTFGFGIREIKRWRLEGLLESLNCQIFDFDGKVVVERPLPRSRVWLLLAEGCYLKPRLKPLEEMWAGLADRFFLRLLDLDGVEGDNFFIVDAHGIEHEFELTRGAAGPRLLGKKLPGITVGEGYPLYDKDTLRLHIPAATGGNNEGLEGWSLSVRPRAGYPGEEKGCALSALQDWLVVPGNDVSFLELPLGPSQLLGEDPCGRYSLYVIDPSRKHLEFKLNFIDNLQAVFSPPVYMVAAGEAGGISLDLTLPEGVSLEVLPPAVETGSAGGIFKVKVDPHENYVRGKLNWGENPLKFEIPVSLEVPKIRWRLLGLNGHNMSNWMTRLEEIWIDDWRKAKELKLMVAVPQHAGGFARLALEGSQHAYDEEIKGGMVNFNLLPFTDSLMDGPVLRCFKLSLMDGVSRQAIAECTAISVRTKWEVKNARLVRELHAEKQVLRLEWDDLGKMQDRVARLWSVSRPWDGLVAEIAIPDGLHAVTIDEAVIDVIIPGQYLARFDVDDPWGGNDAVEVFPQDDYNTVLIQMPGDQAYCCEWEIDWKEHGVAEVCGLVEGGAAGLPVEVFLCGLSNGEGVVWQAGTVLNGDGVFQVTMETVKSVAHWIGIRVGSKAGAFIIAVLPHPPSLELSLHHELVFSSKLERSPCFRVALRELAGLKGDLALSRAAGVKVVEALRESKKAVEFTLAWDDGTNKDAKLEIDLEHHQYTLLLGEGTLCTTCGKLLPNQQAWFEHSSRHDSPSCKSLMPNYVKTGARPVLVWDMGAFLDDLFSSLPIPGPPVLWESRNDSATGEKESVPWDEPSRLAMVLLELEYSWVEKIHETGWLRKDENR